MIFKQVSRSLQIFTPLGIDAIQLVGYQGEEELSRLFTYQLDLLSVNPSIDPSTIVGKNVTFTHEFEDGSRRFFNGFIQRFSAGDEDVKGRRNYRAHVVPWLWFLTQTSDCRIFQEKTIVEIIELIFNDLGFKDYEISQIKGTHPTREYCVQYRESDFEFVCRLMEEEGIYFYFRHEDGKHVMVLADQKGAYTDCKEARVDYPRDEERSRTIVPHIKSWEHQYQFRTGRWSHTDYNFKTPKQRLMVSEKTVMPLTGVERFEQYDFPGEYESKGIGLPLARIRMEELELDHNLVQGTSDCKSFSPGCRFKVGRHRARAEQGKSYVVFRIRHEGRASGYEAGDDLDTRSEILEGTDAEYINRFECFPDSVPFRARRLTPKPIMRGCQTAIVTGPPGEEIYPDEFGRVKVQFHWDREGRYDENSSCWIRVSQPHAGKGWGYMDLPRVGEEVIVDFLEGDPDRPIIVGRVYNGENKPPFDLPAQKTRRGNKTKTYLGSGSNEMSMDDTKGNEQIFIHAQYNMDTVVENNQSLLVGVDRSGVIGNNESWLVKNDQSLAVQKNRTQVVGVDHSETVGNSHTQSVGVNHTQTVGANHTQSVGANQTVSVGSNQTEVVGVAKTSAVGMARTSTTGVISTSTTGIADICSAGIFANLNSAVMTLVAAGVELKLVGPGGSITIGPSGIHIKGKQVTIEGSRVDINP